MRFRAVLVTASLFLCVPLPAASAAGSVAETFTSPGWVSIAVDLDGSPVSGSVSASGVGYPVSVAWKLFTAQGALRQGSSVDELPGERGTYADAHVGDVGVQEDDTTPHGYNPAEATVSMRINETPGMYVGRFVLVFWGAGDFEQWSYEATGGLTVVARESGPDAHFFLARDFDSPAHVETYPVAGLDSWAYGARVQAPGTLTFTVDDTLLGMYIYPFVRTWGAHTATLPSGEVRNCYCYFNDLGGAAAAGPGTYTFTTAGIGVGATIDTGIYLILVDARFPADA